MIRFECTNCRERVFISSVSCVHCGNKLGFDPTSMAMIAIAPAQVTVNPGRDVQQVGGDDAQHWLLCANDAHDACNWLMPANATGSFCVACTLNKTIPDISDAQKLAGWRLLERAKKRLVYSLLRFQLPLDASQFGKESLKFDFVEGKLTGHHDGVITINISETDSVERERQKQYFDEPYRTLLGHLRHESGHFYWNVLVDGTVAIDSFRALFGDERQDYGAALARHHEVGPIDGWQGSCVSAYASVHPWEDWAETWAHYIHMIDAVETAEFEGIEPRAANMNFGTVWPYKRYDVYREESFEKLKARWVPLTIAINALNRSLGHNDFYPFATPERAYEKLAFIHNLIRSWPEIHPS